MTALAIFAGGICASAQEHELPPVDPFAFDPDFRWFEPIYEADMMDMKPKKRAHTGWFATYDYLKMNGNRPDQGIETGEELKFDGQSEEMCHRAGARYDIGYMVPRKETGWLFSFTTFETGAEDSFRVDRIGRLNDENLDGNPEFPVPPFGVPALTEDANNFGFNRRFYNPGITLSDVELDSYEFNKTWRLEPYHYGGILEPMIGFRHVSMSDRASRRTYSRTRGEDGPSPAPFQLSLNPFYVDLGVQGDAYEILDSELQEISNDIYSAQLGFRYFKFKDRFRYSAECRVLTGMNLQCAKRNLEQVTTFYDGFDVGANVNNVLTARQATAFTRNDEFFLGYEIRGELGYQLTKLIHVRGGFQIVDLARGVWRNQRTVDPVGPGQNTVLSFGDQDQGYFALGTTFGIELNR